MKALSWVKRDLRTVVIAVVAAAVTAGGPAIAHGVTHALFAHNADKVDGKHAVGSGASLANAGGKLVATKGSGKFAEKFLPTLNKSFQAVKVSNQSLAGATSSGTALTVLDLDVPAGTYAVTATVGGNAQGTDASRLVCQLNLGSVTAQSIGRIGDDLSHVGQDTWPLTLRVTINAPGTVVVRCWAENLTGTSPFIGASTTRIVAVRLR